MSKIDKLKVSVQKAEEKVEKCKKTIERHKKSLLKKIDKLEKISGRAVDINNIDAHKWDENHDGYDYYWDAVEVGSKLRDIEGAKKKLEDAERVLENWKEKLQNEINKDDFINTLPQVLKDFLDGWKDMAFDWHVKRYDMYLKFAEDLDKQVEKAEAELGIRKGFFPSRSQEKVLKEMELDYSSVRSRKNQYAGATVLQMCTYRSEEERLAYLDRTLENEKRRKAIDLINRINEIVGEIVDVSNLRVNQKLNLDGIVKGTIADAKVETIGAGGWNIQCFHYRTLVHEVK